MTPSKDQLIAARDILDTKWAGYDNAKDVIRALLDSHINPPDLESLKREVVGSFSELEASKYGMPYGAISWTIDHLAPRIVREGCVVVDAKEYQQLKNIQNALLANINMIASSKD